MPVSPRSLLFTLLGCGGVRASPCGHDDAHGAHGARAFWCSLVPACVPCRRSLFWRTRRSTCATPMRLRSKRNRERPSLFWSVFLPCSPSHTLFSPRPPSSPLFSPLLTSSTLCSPLQPSAPLFPSFLLSLPGQYSSPPLLAPCALPLEFDTPTLACICACCMCMNECRQMPRLGGGVILLIGHAITPQSECSETSSPSSVHGALPRVPAPLGLCRRT